MTSSGESNVRTLRIICICFVSFAFVCSEINKIIKVIFIMTGQCDRSWEIKIIEKTLVTLEEKKIHGGTKQPPGVDLYLKMQACQ